MHCLGQNETNPHKIYAFWVDFVNWKNKQCFAGILANRFHNHERITANWIFLVHLNVLVLINSRQTPPLSITSNVGDMIGLSFKFWKSYPYLLMKRNQNYFTYGKLWFWKRNVWDGKQDSKIPWNMWNRTVIIFIFLF